MVLWKMHWQALEVGRMTLHQFWEWGPSSTRQELSRVCASAPECAMQDGWCVTPFWVTFDSSKILLTELFRVSDCLQLLSCFLDMFVMLDQRFCGRSGQTKWFSTIQCPPQLRCKRFIILNSHVVQFLKTKLNCI